MNVLVFNIAGGTHQSSVDNPIQYIKADSTVVQKKSLQN